MGNITGATSFLLLFLFLSGGLFFPLDGQDEGEGRTYTFEPDFPDGTLCLATLTP